MKPKKPKPAGRSRVKYLNAFGLAKSGRKEEALKQLRNGPKSGPTMDAFLSNPKASPAEIINLLKSNGFNVNSGTIYHVRSVLMRLGLIGRRHAPTLYSTALGSDHAKIKKFLHSMQKGSQTINEVADATNSSYNQVSMVALRMRREARLMRKQLNALIGRIKRTKDPKKRAVLLRAIKQLEGIEYFEVEFKLPEQPEKPVPDKLNVRQNMLWETAQEIISRGGRRKSAWGLSPDDIQDVKNICRKRSYGWVKTYDGIPEEKRKPLATWINNHIQGVVADYKRNQKQINIPILNLDEVRLLNSLLKHMQIERNSLQRKLLPGDEELILRRAFRRVKASPTYDKKRFDIGRARRVLDEYYEYENARKSHNAFEREEK